MAQEVFVSQKKVVDFDDVTASVSVPLSSTGTKLTFSKNNQNGLVTRSGRRGRLVFLGNAVDPGGETFITLHLLINGARCSVPPYDSFTQAMGPTYDGQSRISVPIEIAQCAFVQIEADNSDSANAYTAYARLRIEYEDY